MLEYGALINTKSQSGDTALDYADEARDNDEVIEILIEAGGMYSWEL